MGSPAKELGIGGSSTTVLVFREDLGVSGLLSNQGEKYKLLFHNGAFKEKVPKYGTPKPRFRV